MITPKFCPICGGKDIFIDRPFEWVKGESSSSSYYVMCKNPSCNWEGYFDEEDEYDTGTDVISGKTQIILPRHCTLCCHFLEVRDIKISWLSDDTSNAFSCRCRACRKQDWYICTELPSYEKDVAKIARLEAEKEELERKLREDKFVVLDTELEK